MNDRDEPRLVWDDQQISVSGYAGETTANAHAFREAMGRLDGERFTSVAIYRVDGDVRAQLTVHGDAEEGYMASLVLTNEASAEATESWLLPPSSSDRGGHSVVMNVSGVRTPLPSRWLCDAEYVESRAVEFIGNRQLEGSWEDTI